jgi:hypothetical protein
VTSVGINQVHLAIANIDKMTQENYEQVLPPYGGIFIVAIVLDFSAL